jgi:hypothetical protein
VLTNYRRIDAPQLERLAAGDHVRFELARYPDNMFFVEFPTFDTLVESAQQGLVTFRFMSYPPAFCASARWRMRHCGSFVTGKTMLDALVALVEKKALYPLLVEDKSPSENLPLGPTYDTRGRSQRMSKLGRGGCPYLPPELYLGPSRHWQDTDSGDDFAGAVAEEA